MLINREFWDNEPPWLNVGGVHSDITISSRIRLARNLQGYPFPQKASEEKLNEVLVQIQEIVENTAHFTEFQFCKMQQLSKNECQLLMERRLISPEFAKRSRNRAVLFDKLGRSSIMVNEEDHFRLQLLDSGIKLEFLWGLIHDLEQKFEEKLGFSFSKDFGYLTSCPTNTGTGLRISVLMHLPALELEGKLDSIFYASDVFELEVRGFYGEKSDVVGSIYQISNKLTLGWTELKLLEDILKIALQIVDKEQEARKKIFETRNIEIEDKVFRTLGIIERARMLSSYELIEHYSNLIVGIDSGLIIDIEKQELQNILLWAQPAHLQLQYGEDLSEIERDVIRADMVRTRLRL